MHLLNGMITSIDHSKFINISGSNSMVLLAENTKRVSIRHSEFVNNNGYITIFAIVRDGLKMIINIGL